MMVEHNQSANVPSGMGYDNKYKFNGKELDDATGMYYYGARYYDPRISIFVSVDPLTEQTMTPYQYVHNNPIMLIDPTGMSAEQGGDGFWSNIANKAKSLLGINSGQPGVSPIEHTELDEITVSASRKPSFWKRNFSKDKLANDWKNIKENSGGNHFVDEAKKIYNKVNSTGLYKIWGSGREDFGRSDKRGNKVDKHIRSSDMGNIGMGGTSLGANLLFFRIIDGVQMVNSTVSGGVSIKDDENVKNGVESIKRTLYNGYNHTKDIYLTPEQDNRFNDYDTNSGQSFRDSIRKEFYFNTSEKR